VQIVTQNGRLRETCSACTVYFGKHDLAKRFCEMR